MERQWGSDAELSVSQKSALCRVTVAFAPAANFLVVGSTSAAIDVRCVRPSIGGWLEAIAESIVQNNHMRGGARQEGQVSGLNVEASPFRASHSW